MVPLVEELIPCPDPWDIARKLAHLPHLLFLDSADPHPERGRYSYVMADPIAVVESVAIPVEHPSKPHILSGHLFDPEQVEVVPYVRDTPLGLPPFQGGLAGLFGYGINRELERITPNFSDDFELPDLVQCRYEWVIAFDNQANRSWFISHTQYQSQLCEIRNALHRDAPTAFPILRTPPSVLRTPHYPLHNLPHVTSNFSRDGYLAAVRRAIEYIHAGDCFQVNLSQRLLAPLTEHPLELYGRLRQTNPAPFACYFDAGDFQIVSASPERFLKVSPSGDVVTKPIKGTRPRGRTPDEDAELIRELVNSPKDRAENVMIVDLLRNDLGRVCEYGSITVPKVCEVETYRYVHHLVSEVRGKLRAGLTPFDLLRAAFPGGSVTGAPKVRAMEIIAELEPTARGPYCGSVGFIGFDGSMDTNILIRTFTAGRGWVQFPVGGGIVADSDPEREYDETLHKAAGLLRALER